MTDYRFVLIYGAPIEHAGESHVNKYNWQLSRDGDRTGLRAVKRSTWQLQLAVL